jgi:hypothetical protein
LLPLAPVSLWFWVWCRFLAPSSPNAGTSLSDFTRPKVHPAHWMNERGSTGEVVESAWLLVSSMRNLVKLRSVP